MSRKLTVVASALIIVLSGCIGDPGWGSRVTNKCDHRVDVWFLVIGANPESRDDDSVDVAQDIRPGESFSVGGTLRSPGWDIVVAGTEFRVEARRPENPENVTLEFDLEGSACNL